MELAAVTVASIAATATRALMLALLYRPDLLNSILVFSVVCAEAAQYIVVAFRI